VIFKNSFIPILL